MVQKFIALFNTRSRHGLLYTEQFECKMLNVFVDPAAGGLRQGSENKVLSGIVKGAWVQVGNPSAVHPGRVGLWGRWSDPSLRPMFKRPSNTSLAVADYSQLKAGPLGGSQQLLLKSRVIPLWAPESALTVRHSTWKWTTAPRSDWRRRLRGAWETLVFDVLKNNKTKYLSPAGLKSSGAKQDWSSVRGIESRAPVGLCGARNLPWTQHCECWTWLSNTGIHVSFNNSFSVCDTNPHWKHSLMKRHKYYEKHFLYSLYISVSHLLPHRSGIWALWHLNGQHYMLPVIK